MHFRANLRLETFFTSMRHSKVQFFDIILQVIFRKNKLSNTVFRLCLSLTLDEHVLSCFINRLSRKSYYGGWQMFGPGHGLMYKQVDELPLPVMVTHWTSAMNLSIWSLLFWFPRTDSFFFHITIKIILKLKQCTRSALSQLIK